MDTRFAPAAPDPVSPSSEQPASFGSLLARFRETSGLTQALLAAQAGLSTNAISALERGVVRAPYHVTVQALAKALDLSDLDAATFESRVFRGRRPRRRVPGNLLGGRTSVPRPPHAIIARDQELASIARLLRQPEVRLITLLGPAGVGKTRLALEVGMRAASDFPDGVVFVDLAAARNVTSVFPVIAERLELGNAATASLAQVRAFFAKHAVLLILDNFEHLLPAASELPELLTACPELSVIVTSREPLHLQWEHIFPVAPLALPNPWHLRRAAALKRVPAVALFLERAAAHAPRSALTQGDLRTVAELCIHLDGLPLAIELAAVRTRSLSPQMILARLLDRFSLLRWEAPDLPVRHQTLHGAIAWSYDMLNAAEQTLFRQLGVFLGGFSLEAIEAVGRGLLFPDPGADDPASMRRRHLDLVACLVDKSLILSEEDGEGERRFRLLDSMRDYALEQLAVHGELARAGRAHAEYFLQLVLPELTANWGIGWWSGREGERENLRAAVGWLGESGEPELQLRFAPLLLYFDAARGRVPEGSSWLEVALAKAEHADPRVRARALNELGMVCIWQGNEKRAKTVLAEAIQLGWSLGDQSSVALSLTYLGTTCITFGQWKEAASHMRQALAAWRQNRTTWGIAFAYGGLGLVALQRNQPARARTLLKAAVAGARAVANPWFVAQHLNWLAVAAAERGDFALARSSLRQSTSLTSELRDRFLLSRLVGAALSALGDKARPARVARLLGAAEDILGSGGVPAYYLLDARIGRTSALMRGRLGHARFQSALRAGRGASFAETIALTEDLLDSRTGP